MREKDVPSTRKYFSVIPSNDAMNPTTLSPAPAKRSKKDQRVPFEFAEQPQSPEAIQAEDDAHFRAAQREGWSLIGATIAKAVGR